MYSTTSICRAQRPSLIIMSLFFRLLDEKGDVDGTPLPGTATKWPHLPSIVYRSLFPFPIPVPVPVQILFRPLSLLTRQHRNRSRPDGFGRSYPYYAATAPYPDISRAGCMLAVLFSTPRAPPLLGLTVVPAHLVSTKFPRNTRVQRVGYDKKKAWLLPEEAEG